MKTNNMTRKIKYIGFVFLMLLTNTTLAAGYLTSLNTPNVTIKTVFSHLNGGVTLFVTGVSTNPDGCADVTKVHLKGDLIGHKNMVSAALTAFAAGKKVGLYSSGCEIIPFWGGTDTRPIIRELWIVQ